ncbi:ExeM/NucH family extracellular endonuclease [Methylobacterium flocculans]|uniref:ExeM/NucH family extracellular endonuclease n=1 Tax=Methylobacterium flocculans TaxID=2984843 RepID=UPI0021F3B76D|nr:ExeM/NucH family extracellular endonuclease [Methylobacterium sp. FF17]
MTTTPHVLATGPLLQAWTDAGAITTNDDWSRVPGIVGYLGQNVATSTGADPQTLTTSSSASDDVDVLANQTNPNTLSNGGVAEFALSDPTIALQGSATADAPNLVLYLDATGRRDVVVAFNARDIDGSADNAVQPVAVQYRIDGGAWKNVAPGFIADASTQNTATQVTPVSVTLPAEANGAAGLQVRILTTNAVGNDEWVGIDDIAVSSESAAVTLPTLSIADARVVEGNAGNASLTFTVTLSAPAPDGGVSFDVATADGTATAGSDYSATVLTGRTIAAGATTATITVPVTGDTLAEGSETLALRVANVVGATVADGAAIGTIVNDDASFTVNGVAVFDAAASLQGNQGATATTPPTGTDALQLVRLGSYATTNDPATTAGANAEVVAYDRTTASLYIQNTNENRIEIVGIGADGQMAKSGEIQLATLEQYGAVNSVAVSNGLVAVAYANATGDQPGRVALFDQSGTLLKSVTVGIGPDQIVFTADGTKLLVANEGEQFTTASNPVGSVSILDLSGGAAAAIVSATVGFGALDGSEAALRAKGLAVTAGKAASADIEPEYITLSPDNRFAYVTLQEVNGLAVIDLANPGTAPIAIQPLGSVNHSLAGNEFDASDRDGTGNTASIRIASTPASTPIYGLLQPDAAASFSVNGVNYVITANEGDQRVIGGSDDSADVARLSSIANTRLSPELQALKADPAYARLNVLLRTGDTNGDGLIDQLHTLGGRGISIFRQEADNSLTKVRETGGEFEKIFAALAPERFNNDQVVANTPDDRSDNKGPEPEGVTVGTVNGRTYAFVGLERQSGVLVYDVTDPETASYVSYVPPLAGVTADLGPEVLTFIAADRNPTGTPLLVTANEAGGGATLYAALPQGYTQTLAFQPGSLTLAQAEGDTGTTTFAFTVERTGGTLGSLAFTANLAGADSADFAGAPTLPATVSGTIPAGATSAVVTVTVQGDTLPEADEAFTVTLTGATASQSGITAALATSGTTATGTILNDDVTLISAVQGSGSASTLVGRTVTIEAIVVGDFQNGDADAKRNLGGFYLQEEATDADGNLLTSEGVFVYEGAGTLLRDVQEGDRVRITGVVGEFSGETQISVTDAAGLQIVQAGAVSAAALKASAASVDLPAAATIGTGTTAQPDLERYEGMLVKLGQTLTVTEQFNLDRFNEIRLAAGARPETFTNEFEPDSANYAAYLAQVAARSITYDDGLNVQNQPVELLDGFGPTYGTATAPRMGDTVTGLTGVLGYGPAGAYRVRAIEDGDNAFAQANPRTAAPDDVGGSLKVGSLNVLNYFRTLDSDGSASGVKTAIGLDPRGANTTAEFDRQTQKLVTTVIASGADVFGLTELENQFQPGNPGNALEYLVGQLNARAGAGTYDWVRPGDQLDQGQFLGGDAIAVGFVYKPSKVSVALNTTIEKLDDTDVQAFDPALLQQSTIGHIFNGANTSRAALAVTFRETATGEDFTAVINHLKSKSGAGTGADADQGDGQGGWQQQRELAATALKEWLALKPTGTPDSDVVLLGDFNAYIKEDALDVLKAGGFTNLAEDRLANPYSYVFDGAYGALDHALANGSLNGQVTGVTEWHINADEADAIDYNLDFGRSAAYFDGLTPARESDHDPILVGLSLDQTAPRLLAATPADNTLSVAVGANIGLSFSEAVRAGTGAITLTDGAGDTRSIAVTDASQVSISGTTVTINPGTDLKAGTAYDVILPAGALLDAAGNTFAGLPQDQLDFTTETPPAMTYTLQILHASDWEAGLLATQRAANFAAIVDKLEDSTPNSITLSTGDGWIPSPFFIAGADPQLAATYNGVYNQLFGLSGSAAYTKLTASVGRADVTIQNIIGVQAAVFGNHEFDSGPTEVANIIAANLGTTAGNADDTWVGAQFPYLSTNLNFSREAALSGLVNANVANATFAQTGPTSTQTGTGADKIAKSTILVENGEKIAFVGATTQLEPLLTTLGNVTVDGFNGQDNIALLAEQINAEVDRVLAANPDLNKVVVGTHLQQLANEQALAPLLRNVDVLIGGGSHTLLADGDDRLLSGDTAGGTYPQFFTNASGQTLALVNTASEYSYVGRLTVTFDDQGNVIRDSVNSATSGAVAVDDATVTQLYGSTAAAFTPGSKGFLVREVIEGLDANNDGVQETAGIADVIRQQDGNILGRSSVYLEGRRGEVRTEETNLGDLSSDANLWYAKQFDAGVTVSIKNGGGIRDSIGSFSTAGGGTAELPPAANLSAGKQAGDISQLDVTNSLRFNNNLAVVTVTAAELERVLEHGVAAVAPGATPGQFTQVGGISYSFDATKQAQTLDLNGNVTREGQRIVSAAIIDADGRILDTLVQDGQVVGDASRAIKVVTLDFLATGTATAPGLGGDNYPFPAYGENKVALRDASPVSLPDTETFAVKGSEQDALAEYLKAFHATTPYGTADTGPAGDLRIQNLAARTDAVLQRGVANTGADGADTLRGTAFSDVLKGGAGDDIIYNSLGDDILIGGSGPGGANQNDTLIFATALADAQVTQAGGFTIVTGPEGRDAISGFERIQFSDTTVVLDDGNRLVDDLFYLARNKDVLAAGQDADAHYAAYGAAEGRDPNAYFSTKGYLATYTDVAKAGLNPLSHYDADGWKEGRDPGVNFDTQFYLARNTDVKAAGLDPLTHYLEYGQAEGRAIFDAVGLTGNIKGGFDAEFYLLANADVAQVATLDGGDTLAFARQHFDTYGWKEGRDPNAVFDTKGYLAAYGDVAAAGINPLAHYDTYGWKEGRDPSADFDSSEYLAVNGDVAQAGLNPMQHYLQYGLVENRAVLNDGTFGYGTIA